MMEQWEYEQEQIKQILEREEYRAYLVSQSGENPVKSWLKQLWEKITGLLPDGTLSDGSYRIIGWSVLGLLAAGLLVIIFYSSRNLVRGMRRKRQLAVGVEEMLEMETDQLLAHAEQYARTGAFDEAVRYRYLALLKELEVRGLVKARAWKTNREYRTELAACREDLVPQFEQVTARFEAVYYGRLKATDEDYTQVATIMNRYVQEADEHAKR